MISFKTALAAVRRYPFLVSLVLSAFIIWLIPKALFYAPEPIGSRADLFQEGILRTLELTGIGAFLGLIIGIFFGLGKLAQNLLIRLPASFGVWILRGTPLLVQILFVYYAAPAIFPSLRLNEFWAAAVALALNVGAYNAEVVRAGVLAIPKGQTEAAFSLGLSKFQNMRWIVLPQALKLMVPPLLNNIVALLKDSSLASSIGLVELTLVGTRISSETFLPVPVLLTIAFTYLTLTTLISFCASMAEKGARQK